MKNFNFKNKRLYCEKVSVPDICEKFETPFYLYSKKSIIDKYKLLSNHIKNKKVLIAYAVKANSNLSILKILQKCGAGADVVSLGELVRVKEAGFHPNKIVYSGVGKRLEEIIFALDFGILQFNVESIEELFLISEVAQKKNMSANIAIRVNPDIKAGSHPKISTGKKTDKFGIDILEAEKVFTMAKSMKGIRVVGVDIHIGSQITNINAYKKAFKVIYNLTKKLDKMNFKIQNIDLGGGIGLIDDKRKESDFIKKFSLLINNTQNKLEKKVIIEPGRYLVGDAGIIVTKILFKKTNSNKNFLIIDAGMNDFMRPALYSAQHNIETLFQKSSKKNKFDIVGPICETSDIMAKNVMIDKNIGSNSFLFISQTGAYGSVMSSNYNSRNSITELLVEGNKVRLIKRKVGIKEMLKFEKF